MTWRVFPFLFLVWMAMWGVLMVMVMMLVIIQPADAFLYFKYITWVWVAYSIVSIAFIAYWTFCTHEELHR